MAVLHRLFYLGWVALLLTPFGQAQAPSETETSSANSSPGGWLGKEDPQAVAWRAYDAMLAHDESAIAELVSLAARWVADEDFHTQIRNCAVGFCLTAAFESTRRR